MKILGDYHTHTIYSHGKGDIIDNAKMAQEKGLKELAITDHAFGHIMHGMKRSKVAEMKQKIRFAEIETGLKIYFGVEANFTSLDGDIDMTQEDINNVDLLLVGYHKIVKAKLRDKFKFFLPNLFKGSRNRAKQIERNTQAIIKAMDKYPIDIIVHLNHDMSVNVEEIAKKAVETNTIIELNTSKEHLSKEQIKILVKSGVKFILSSDAHMVERVGKVDRAMEWVKQYKIPVEQIVNLDKVPVFKKFKK